MTFLNFEETLTPNSFDIKFSHKNNSTHILFNSKTDIRIYTPYERTLNIFTTEPLGSIPPHKTTPAESGRVWYGRPVPPRPLLGLDRVFLIPDG